MYKLELDVRGCGIKRYVAYFRGRHYAYSGLDSYFSVEVECANSEQAYQTLLDANRLHSIETCVIQQPETMTFYELIHQTKRTSNDVFTYLANLLVEHRVVPKGTPVEISFKQDGIRYSFIVMNAGLKNPAPLTADDLHYLTVVSLWNEFGDTPINDEDEITEAWQHFEKGTNRFEIWHWFEESMGYSIHQLAYKES
jgi:hypothetical protein